MKKLNKFILPFRKLGFIFYIVSGLWAFKSKVLHLWNKYVRKDRAAIYKVTPLINSVKDLDKYVKDFGYIADGIEDLGDAVSEPSTVYARYLNGQPVGDCDDRAKFFSYVLSRSQKSNGMFKDLGNYCRFYYMVVIWESAGHAVCAIQEGSILSFGSGPASTTPLWYLDYLSTEASRSDNSVAYGNFPALALKVKNSFAPTDELVGWAIFDPETNKLIDWSIK